MNSLDYNPIFENDFYSDPVEMTPEDIDNINEFLDEIDIFDLSQESTIAKFSYKGEI